MLAGRMDRQITLQGVTESRSASGATVETWTALEDGTVWAQLIEPSGRESREAGGDQARLDRTFKIHHRTDVTAKCRILYDDGSGELVHDILAIKELGRREGLEITTTAKVN